MSIYVDSETPRVQFTVTSATTQFAFDFNFFQDSDIKVYVDSTLKTLTTHYSVTGEGNDTASNHGGTVTFGSAVNNCTVTIIRDITIQRVTDFPASGSFQVDSLNTELDTITAVQQELEDDIARSLRLDDEDATVAMTLPLKASRLGKYLAFNSSTGVPEAGASSDDVTTLASQTSNINTLAGIASNVSTVAGISANVTTVAGISSSVASVAGVASLITSDFVTDLNVLATSAIVEDLNILATSDIVSDLNTLATSDIVTDLNKLATDDIVSDLNTLATTDIVNDLNTLATSDIVTDLNLLATSAIVEDLNLLATSSVIADMATLAGSGASPNITSLTTSGSIELGHASDTTISRSASGTVQIEGNTIVTTANSDVGATTTSSSDADHVLINDGGVLKKITPTNLGIGTGVTEASATATSVAMSIALG